MTSIRKRELLNDILSKETRAWALAYASPLCSKRLDRRIKVCKETKEKSQEKTVLSNQSLIIASSAISFFFFTFEKNQGLDTSTRNCLPWCTDLLIHYAKEDGNQFQQQKFFAPRLPMVHLTRQ